MRLHNALILIALVSTSSSVLVQLSERVPDLPVARTFEDPELQQQQTQGLFESQVRSQVLPQTEPSPYDNLLSNPEVPGGGTAIRVNSSSPDVGLLVFGRISLDTVTSNGRLLAPYGYIFLGPRFEESQWTNTISARQSTLGFIFTGPDVGELRSLARFETYFLSSVTDANVYGLAQYFLYG